MEPSVRLRLAAAVAAAAATLAGVMLFGSGSAAGPAHSSGPGTTHAPVSPSARADAVTMHVSGAVLRPGLVRVDSTARIADVLAAAGGATPDADLSGLNLAAPARDGARVVVPVAGAAPGEPGAAGDEARVSLNLGTVQDLERLPGVGPVLARRIVDHRESHGPFAEIEDLLDVPGIGEAKLAAMRDAVALP